MEIREYIQKQIEEYTNRIALLQREVDQVIGARLALQQTLTMLDTKEAKD